MSEHRFGSGVPTVKEILEALFFATDEPLQAKQVVEIVQSLDEGERPRGISEETVLRIIGELNETYEETGRAFRIVKVAGGYQFATLPKFALWLGRMVKERARRKLSQAALESLAVIAYKQPVTKPEIEAIRGVNADYIMRSLLERNLITIVGRAATPGRPLLYGTTMQFLRHFGLNDLSELPKPREIDELLAEADFEVEKRMLADLEDRKTGTDPGTDDSTGVVVSEDGKLRTVDRTSRDEEGIDPSPDSDVVSPDDGDQGPA